MSDKNEQAVETGDRTPLKQRVSEKYESVRAWLHTNIYQRLQTTPRQELLTRMFFMASVMVTGATSAVAGFVLLILSAIAMSTIGVILSSFSLVFGLALAFVSYIWFT